MIWPGRDRLSGTIEVDESYLGGLEAGSHGRGAERKALIAAQRRRMAGEPDASGCSISPTPRLPACCRS
jgi:hypothetical protein